jgi:uncharacterized membrane protein
VLALIGLAATALALGAVFLPIWSFIRIYRLTNEVARLSSRLESLERWAAQAGSRERAATTPHGVRSPDASMGVEAPPAPASPPPPEIDAAAQSAGTAPSPGAPDGHWAHGSGAEASARLPVAPAVGAAATPDDLESRVGGRWLLYIGVTILLIGVSFFLKYAFDNAWVDETGRVVIGMISGALLVAGGWRASMHLPIFGRALTGTGLAVLYLSIYAALQFYTLIAPWTAFALMLATTLVATWLADRSGAQSLALIAAAGGFLTPLLVSGTRHETVSLLSYVLLLDLGVALLIRRHDWAALPAVAYVLTLITLGAWADDGYTRSEWATVLAFLTALAVVFADMLRHVWPRPGVQARFATALLATGPLVYHVTALAITADHPPAIHVYLIVFTAVGLLATPGPDRAWLRLVLLIVVYVPIFAFIRETTLGQSWFVATLVTTSAIAVMHAIALIDRVVRQGTSLGTADCLVLHAAVIGLFGVSAELLSPRYPEWRGGAAALLALGSSALWFFFESRDRVAALNAAGLSFTLVALAIAVQFEGRVVEIGWAVEGAVAAWVGIRTSNAAFRFGGVALWLLSLGRLMDGYVAVPGETTPLLNERSLATVVVVALAYLIAWWWRSHEPAQRTGAIVPIGLHVAASVLTMLWISAEIDVFWEDRAGTRQAALTEELVRSLAWGLYGAVLIVVGLWRGLPSLRWIGIGAIGLTVLKVFIVDLSRLGGIYRVIGFLVVGILLVAVSYLYQRTRRTSAELPSP